jgi:hypothetical protein
MPRISTYFAAFALGVAVLLTAASAQAQCANADICSPAECRAKHNTQIAACRQSFSCARAPRAQWPARLQIAQGCLNARRATGACFSTMDEGHQKAISYAENAVRNCGG